jgi:hypothetical protein
MNYRSGANHREATAVKPAAVLFNPDGTVRHAAGSTIEALAYSLRRGVDALSRIDVINRLHQLDEHQFRDMATRLLNRTVAPSWTEDEIAILHALWRRSK